MKMTLVENLNTESIVLRHKILVQSIGLISGREGVLETEKDLYLILALLDNIIEEDLVKECNEDERELAQIMEEDLEPFFFNLIKEEKYNKLYTYVRKVFLDKCKEIWDNQHSLLGVIDTILTVVSTMDEEQKGEILESTANVAKAVYEKRTEELSAKADKANSKLEQLVEMYQRKEGNMENSNAE